jgi:hypothetical protein
MRAVGRLAAVIHSHEVASVAGLDVVLTELRAEALQ